MQSLGRVALTIAVLYSIINEHAGAQQRVPVGEVVVLQIQEEPHIATILKEMPENETPIALGDKVYANDAIVLSNVVFAYTYCGSKNPIRYEAGPQTQWFYIQAECDSSRSIQNDFKPATILASDETGLQILGLKKDKILALRDGTVVQLSSSDIPESTFPAPVMQDGIFAIFSFDGSEYKVKATDIQVSRDLGFRRACLPGEAKAASESVVLLGATQMSAMEAVCAPEESVANDVRE